MDFITVNEKFQYTIEIKKSEFIGTIYPAKTIEEADDYLAEIKKEHYKATHNTYAYIIGEKSEFKKASDDGEPSGTAGKPILSVMENNKITNALVVVTRYFGGIKLGASGLIRAYSRSASEVIKHSELINKIYTREIIITYDYTLHGKIETFLHSTNYNLAAPEFTDTVSYKIFVPVNETEKFKEELISLTNAKIKINEGNYEYIDRKIEGDKNAGI